MHRYSLTKPFLIYALFLLSFSLAARVNEKMVVVSSLEELANLDRTDSVRDLVIAILKKPDGVHPVRLKHPASLRSLSIHHPGSYVFADSLPNLSSIGIEGDFYGTLNMKYDPLKIDTFTVYNIRNDNYSFLEQFKNLHYLDVGFYRGKDKLFDAAATLRSLRSLSFYSHKGSVRLPLTIRNIASLEHIEGNIKFDPDNLRLLAEMKSLSEITFTLIRIRKVPSEYYELRSRKKVLFLHCKGKPDLMNAH